MASWDISADDHQDLKEILTQFIESGTQLPGGKTQQDIETMEPNDLFDYVLSFFEAEHSELLNEQTAIINDHSKEIIMKCLVRID